MKNLSLLILSLCSICCKSTEKTTASKIEIYDDIDDAIKKAPEDEK